MEDFSDFASHVTIPSTGITPRHRGANFSAAKMTGRTGAQYDFGTGDWTLSFWGYPTELTSYNIAIDKSGGGPTFFFIGTLGSAIIAFVNGGNVNGGTVVQDTWTHFLAKRESGTVSLYLNGVFVTSSSLTGTVTGTNPLLIGDTTGGGLPWAGDMELPLIHNRALTDLEIRTLAQAPWSMFQEEQPFLHYVPASAAYTLALGQASFALSGQAIGLQSARTLSLAYAGFALGGQTVAVKHGHALSLTYGGFSLSGQDLGLRSTRQIGLGQASFSLSGQDIGPRASRSLSLGFGSFVLDGQMVFLEWSGQTGGPSLFALMGCG